MHQTVTWAADIVYTDTETHALIETNQEPISYLSIWQFYHVAKFNCAVDKQYLADFAVYIKIVSVALPSSHREQ